MENYTTAIEAITREKKVTKAIRLEYFRGWGFAKIRDWLEEHGIDRHTAIEFISTEIALICPRGLIMQVRASDSNKLGLWGGVVNDDEKPEDGAVREIREETGVVINVNQLEFSGIDAHSHTYANGDMAAFTAYRYIVRLDYNPEIHIEGAPDESTGVCYLTPILDHQKEFVNQILGNEK